MVQFDNFVESPIELKILQALISYPHYRDRSAVCLQEPCRDAEIDLCPPPERYDLCITLQHETCGYRLDFAAYARKKQGCTSFLKFGLECDGKEHHTGIKNAARDFERDCVLVKNGWFVIRAPGHIIHKAPIWVVNGFVTFIDECVMFKPQPFAACITKITG